MCELTFMAYQGKDDCTSLKCRRYIDPSDPQKPGCIGWHCAVCDKPSGQYGHKDCHEELTNE